MADYCKAFTRKIINPVSPDESYMLKLYPGYTTIAHVNPKIRTNLLNQIAKAAKNADFNTYYYDAFGAFRYRTDKSVNQLIFDINKQINDAKYQNKPLCIMLDRPDIGLTLPELRKLRNHIAGICRNIHVKADCSADWPIYIIAATDNFELAQNLCLNPENGNTTVFGNYRDFVSKLMPPENED